MALIECHECGNDISSLAEACPQCGAPVRPGVETIEKTGKTWKGMKLISALLAAGAFGGYATKEPSLELISSCILLIAACLYLYATFGTWWHHE